MSLRNVVLGTIFFLPFYLSAAPAMEKNTHTKTKELEKLLEDVFNGKYKGKEEDRFLAKNKSKKKKLDLKEIEERRRYFLQDKLQPYFFIHKNRFSGIGVNLEKKGYGIGPYYSFLREKNHELLLKQQSLGMNIYYAKEWLTYVPIKLGAFGEFSHTHEKLNNDKINQVTKKESWKSGLFWSLGLKLPLFFLTKPRGVSLWGELSARHLFWPEASGVTFLFRPKFFINLGLEIPF